MQMTTKLLIPSCPLLKLEDFMQLQPSNAQLPWHEGSTINVYAWRQEMVKYLSKRPSKVAVVKAHYKHNPQAFVDAWCDTYIPRTA
jgi:hypothetical protein